MSEQSLQSEIYAAVEARGYVAPFSPGTFQVRQFLKAVDEMGEVAQAVIAEGGNLSDLAEEVCDRLYGLSHIANMAFRNKAACHAPAQTADSAKELLQEIADVVIPLLCLAESLKREGLVTTDLLGVVREKALADVKRGVSQ